MGLVHTPRTLVAIGRGLLRRGEANSSRVGFGDHAHIYKARAGLLDLDFMGHMNNASYLTHAELARWQMTAQNDMLQRSYRKKCFFIVTSNAVRYRKEIPPGTFSIETRFMGFDDRNLWGIHNFYVPTDASRRVRAQILVKAAVLQGKTILSPNDFYTTILELDAETIEKQQAFYGDHDFMDMVKNFDALEGSMRTAASRDEEYLV